MEEKNNIVYARVLRSQDGLNSNWTVVVTVCEKAKYIYICPGEPNKKIFHKCINKAVNAYIHGGN